MRRVIIFRWGMLACVFWLVGCSMSVDAPAPSQSLVAQPAPSLRPTAAPAAPSTNPSATVVPSEAAVSSTPAASSDATSSAPTSRQIFVDPEGNDDHAGSSPDQALRTINAALQLAEPGDVISLAPGEYWEDIRSVRAGTQSQPIKLQGPQDAIVRGNGKINVFEITHDYIVFDGFTIDGLADTGDKVNHFRRKLIYAYGVTGLKVLRMTLRNAGSACLRLQNKIRAVEVAYTSITTCGVIDFRFDGGGANGEGIYVGTAPNHTDGAALDDSHDIWIHHNTINTNGSECVDIKPGSFQNVIEHNRCWGSQRSGVHLGGDRNILRDNEILGAHEAGVVIRGATNQIYANTLHENGECIDIKQDATGNLFERNSCMGAQKVGVHLRGTRNIIRNNVIDGASDAAVVLSGVDNELYDNKLHDNVVGFEVWAEPQAKLCCNSLSNTGQIIVGTTLYDPVAPDS